MLQKKFNETVIVFFEQQLYEMRSLESRFASLSSEASLIVEYLDLKIALGEIAKASLSRLEILKSVLDRIYAKSDQATAAQIKSTDPIIENRLQKNDWICLEDIKRSFSQQDCQKLLDSQIARVLRRLCMLRFSDYCTLLSTAENINDSQILSQLQPLVNQSGLEAELLGTLLDDELLTFNQGEWAAEPIGSDPSVL